MRVVWGPVSLPEGRQVRELPVERFEGYEVKRTVSRLVIAGKIASSADRESQ